MGRHGEPIELELDDILKVVAAEQVADTPVEVAQFRIVQRVVEAQHGGAVLHLQKALARLAPHALGRRIRRSELGVLGLQFLETPHQRVVFRVRDFGLVENVVEMFVAAKLIAELVNFARGIFHRPLNYNLTRNFGEIDIPAKKNTVLIYNPNAGRFKRGGGSLIQRAVQILTDNGHAVTVAPTTGPGTAGAIAK